MSRPRDLTRGRDEILDLVARMHRERNMTVILVSHSMEDVAKYVERIIVMNHGQVMFDDTPKEVFRHYKELETIGLAAPPGDLPDARTEGARAFRGYGGDDGGGSQSQPDAGIDGN